MFPAWVDFFFFFSTRTNICCCVTGVSVHCMCSLTLTIFLESIPWIKLERLWKNRSAAVPWRDRRGRGRGRETHNTGYMCGCSFAHLYNNLLLFPDGSVASAQRSPHPFHLRATSTETAWLPEKIHRICTGNHEISPTAEMHSGQ